jgi:hypothetical protein
MRRLDELLRLNTLGLTPDGKRVVVFPRSESDASAAPRRITLLTDFFSHVQRRVPDR